MSSFDIETTDEMHSLLQLYCHFKEQCELYDPIEEDDEIRLFKIYMESSK
jgi:hypothetical protein